MNSSERIVSEVFQKEFSGEYLVVRSPGRINIIGEHTDYNEGFVLPGAIDKAAYAAAGKRNDGIIRIVSPAFGETFEMNTSDIRPSGQGWPDYVLGMAAQLINNGKTLPGFNMVIDGDVPIGSGMSSSAALECAALFCLDQLFDYSLDRLEMAQMAQRGEQEFAGVMVGIMDQFASLLGKKDHVMELDCRSMEYRYKPFRIPGHTIILLNTNVHHSLASSEYNLRRNQCMEGVKLVSEQYPGVRSLRDCNVSMLEECLLPGHLETFTRCRYVIRENARVLMTCEALEADDIHRVGQLMYSSHEGLSKEYDVSCDELDFLVENTKSMNSVLGARMMGGGFGGCTINIVKEASVDEIIMTLSKLYFDKFRKELTSYTVSIEDGTSVIYR